MREPFVAGADTIIDRMVEGIPNAKRGFKLVFSADPFPGYNAHFVRVREEYDGNVYRAEELGMEGWLCPALLKYFERAPTDLYAKFEPLRR